MRILIDILHPAHAHFFRPFYWEMKQRGHAVTVTAREKEMTVELLNKFGIEHVVLSHQPRHKFGLGWELAKRTFRLIRLARDFKPDVLTGIMGASIAPAGRLLNIPAIVFYDTEHSRYTNLFTYPLAAAVCTPDSYRDPVRGRHVEYAGYHELAYLHPNRFQPDASRLDRFGVDAGQPYFIVRFVSWQAIHDLGHAGLSQDVKLQIVKALQKKGQVVISSEGPVPDSLQNMVLQGPVNEIHHLLAYARGVVGESATMCSEAAVLGVPSLYINPLKLGYLEEQENSYNLVQNLSPDDVSGVLSAVDEFPRGDAGAARQRLLEEKIDVSEWMVRFFESEVRS